MNRGKPLKRSVCIILLLLLITGCQSKDDAGYILEDSEIFPTIVTTNPSDLEASRLLSLSDDQISEAIEKGASLTKDTFSDYREGNLLPILHNDISGSFAEKLQPEVVFKSNYYQIVESSFVKSQKYDNLTVEEAGLDGNKNYLIFVLTAYGNKITMSKNFSAVIKQGDAIFKPYKDELIGSDRMASQSSYWPNFPAYYSVLSAMFADFEALDLTKKAEFIFLYDGKERSVTYDIDFSKYK
ncbi:MAG: hypothetical protein WD469_10585 [Paenibacillaceae bacterium]